MKQWLRMLCLILAMLFLLASLAGCKKEEEAPTETTGDTAAIEAPSDVAEESTEEPLRYDANGYLMDDLPETYDWQGREYKVYSWSENKNEEWVDADEDTSTGWRRDLYERQFYVEERFKTKFKFTFAKGSWDFREEFVQTMENMNMTDSEYFDLVGFYTISAGIAASKKLLTNLNEVEYLDFSKPWWPQDLNSANAIGDNLYFATGDITPTQMMFTFGVCCNLKLWDELKLSDQFDGRTVYDVVRDHDWTLENMLNAARNSVDDYSDFIAFGCGINAYEETFLYGGGYRMVENNNGVLELSPNLTGTRLINLYETVQTFFSGAWLDCAPGALPDSFIDGNTLFQTIEMRNTITFTQNANFDFVVLPTPMADKDQDAYYTNTAYWVTMYGIPESAPDKAFAGMILEGLASQSHRDLVDTIYYNHFQSRYAGSDNVENLEMFDIVMDSVVYDTARVFAYHALGNVCTAFRDGVRDDTKTDTSWMTIYGANSSVWKKEIEDLYALLG